MFVSIHFSTLEEFLLEYGRTFGEAGAAPPYPRWWPQFDLWYRSVSARGPSRRSCIETANTMSRDGPEWVRALFDEYQRMRSNNLLRQPDGTTAALVWVEPVGPSKPDEI